MNGIVSEAFAFRFTGRVIDRRGEPVQEAAIQRFRHNGAVGSDLRFTDVELRVPHGPLLEHRN
jgi:hypothetical protein